MNKPSNLSVPTALLQVQQLNKIYHPNTEIANQVLFDISLQLNPGEFCALVGPSGSGKSSLLNLLGLLDQVSSGEIIIDGIATAQLNDAELTKLRGQKIGFVFQFHHLLPAFSALENILMPQLIKQQPISAAAREQAQLMLEKVGLGDKAGKFPQQLSGGQQQRLAIARALLARPQLLLADEPTGNLDSNTANEIFDLLYQLNQTEQSACLMVTHDPRLAAKCDRVLEVIDGRLQ